MHRLLGCVLLLSAALPAQSIETTLLALKDPRAPRKALSNQLIEDMMGQARGNQQPSHTIVQRFSDELTAALLGKDITPENAAALHKAISGVLSGKGSTALPANKLYETLIACGVNQQTIRPIVDRFTEIGRQVRGPDDSGVRPLNLK